MMTIVVATGEWEDSERVTGSLLHPWLVVDEEGKRPLATKVL